MQAKRHYWVIPSIKRLVTQEEILEILIPEVCKLCNIPESELIRNIRIRKYVRARAALIYILRTYYKPHYSFKKIGKEILFRDHSTIIHSMRQTEDLLENDTDELLSAVIEKLKFKMNLT